MKFDVIIGNPPYQQNIEGSFAKPIYHHFIEQAKQMNPKYLTMIIPAKWFSEVKKLDKFREDMINDKRISHLVDYPNYKDVFQGVTIKGGVCYFIWDKDKTDSNCKVINMRGKEVVSEMIRPLKYDNADILIRNNDAISIVNKLKDYESFKEIVTDEPFGLNTAYRGKENKSDKNNIKLYRTRGVDYIAKDEIKKNHAWVQKYKVFMGNAAGGPYLGKPNVICTETYFSIGNFDDYETAYNICSYMATRTFRFLVSLARNGNYTTPNCYQFVPLLNFSKSWSDEELYKLFKLDEKEIELIENRYDPMESDFKNPYENK